MATLDELKVKGFSTVGNIYVDGAYVDEASTPATDPITGEALVFGENAFGDLTGDVLPALPEDGKAAFVTNVARSFDKQNFYFSRSDGSTFDVYASNLQARN